MKIKNHTETVSPLEIPFGDLSARLQKISEQTGLSSHNLLQKWILQEESLIGLMQHGQRGQEQKGHAVEHEEARPEVSRQPVSASRKRKEAQKADLHGSEDYRETLAKRAMELKKEGMTLAQIAKVFNEENIQTLSGNGKWNAGPLARFLNAKS
jgi:hypothetical protein